MQLEDLFGSSSDDHADDEAGGSHDANLHDEKDDEEMDEDVQNTNTQPKGYGQPQQNHNSNSVMAQMNNAFANTNQPNTNTEPNESESVNAIYANQVQKTQLEFNSDNSSVRDSNPNSTRGESPNPPIPAMKTTRLTFDFNSDSSSSSHGEDVMSAMTMHESPRKRPNANTRTGTATLPSAENHDMDDMDDMKETEAETTTQQNTDSHSPTECSSPPRGAPSTPLASSKSKSKSKSRPTSGNSVDVDMIIQKLLAAQNGVRGREIKLPEQQILNLCQHAQQLMMSQPMFFELSGPINIVGDVHGQFYDLLNLFKLGGFPPDTNYLFLGDYVDRGHQSLETICLLLAYKLKYPENFFILRGNHESSSISRVYGFFDECKRRYTMRVWKTFCDLFNCFPVAARVDDMIICMHGGLSPDLRNFEQLKSIVRPTDVPHSGLLCDILWSDPDKNNMGWGVNDRGLSYTFGADVLQEFLSKHEMDMIIRAHQVVEDGYEFFANRQCVTVFSAPNYCGEYDNAAAIVAIDSDLYVSILLLPAN